jgi:two-component system OmpR family response regulator
VVRADARNTDDKVFPERSGRVGEKVQLQPGLPQARERVVAIMKTVFTTGEAAKICKVSQQTIIRCFDSGQLKGFRVPGSRFRRIPREQLFAFMKDNGIPTDALESGKRRVLIVDDDADLVDLLVDVFERDGRFDVRSANNGFEAGMAVKEFKPDLVVLDVMLPDINGKEVCQRVRSDRTMLDVKIVCISGMVEQDKIQDLRDAGANDFMQKPFTVEVLLERCCGMLDMEPITARR